MQRWKRLWREDDGVLTFEWVLLLTLLTIGIVGGLAAVRDGIIDELGDIAKSALAIDQSYRVDYAPDIVIHTPPAAAGGSDSQYTDTLTNFQDCERSTALQGQPAVDDGDTP